MTNLILPSELSQGVSEKGRTSQSGPVSSTSSINNAMPLDALTPSVLGILSSFSRFESYQIFSTDERRVNIVKGERAIQTPLDSICSPDITRKRRPDVRTRSQITINRPSRFNAI